MIFHSSINKQNSLTSIKNNLKLMHYQIIILWLVDFVNSNMLQLEFN
jgi:hypothetical protein